MAIAPRADGQPVRRNDFISLVDRLRCTQPHYRGSSPGLVPEGSALLAAHAAGTLEAIDRGAFDDRNADALGQLRLDLSTLKPCSDGSTLSLDVFLADAGQLGAIIDGVSPGLPFGCRGEFCQESRGSIWAYVGGSTSRRPVYDPSLDLTRDAWIGTTVQLGIPAKVWLPKFGSGKVVFATFASLQGDYAWEADVRAARGHSVVPHFNLTLPIAVMRSVNGPAIGELPIVGLTYSLDRVQNFAPAGALQRQVLALTTQWFGGHLALTVHGGRETLGGRRIYQELGLTLEPTRCTRCQITF